jgi:hypothetical protein
MDSFAYALVGPATANMLGHRLVNLAIRRMMELPNQRGGFHDHAGLAKSALGDIFFKPCQLAGMADIGGKAFYGREVFAGCIGDMYLARPYGIAVFVDGACATNSYAASIFCTGQPQIVPQHPEQGSVRIGGDPVELAVDVKTVLSHARILSEFDDLACHSLGA